VKERFQKLFDDRQTFLAALIARAAPKNLIRRDRALFLGLYNSDSQMIVEFYT